MTTLSFYERKPYDRRLLTRLSPNYGFIQLADRGLFLDFARPSQPRLVTLAVQTLFSRVQSLLAPQWKKTAIRLIVEPPPAVWIRVDPHQMEQVLINLVQNAADSIDREGDITLRARADTIRLAGRATPAVIVEVTDTGKGIPPEVQKRIFDPFFTTKESGTGLGLAIAASIVEKNGGAHQPISTDAPSPPCSRAGRTRTATTSSPRTAGATRAVFTASRESCRRGPLR